MKNNNEKDILYKRALITCLIMLLISILFKLFGASWFDLNTDIPLLQEMDKIVENNILILFINTLIFRTLNGVLITSLMVKDFKKVIKNIHLLTIISLLAIIGNIFDINSYLLFVYDFTSLIIFSKLISDASIKECLLVMILNVIYQLISVYIRDLGVRIQSYGFLNYTILSLDYYIMLIITYLYLKKGESTICSAMVASCSSLKCRLLKKRSKDYSVGNE